MIGLITPPYGILLFVISAVTGIPLVEIIREIWGFLAVLLIALLTSDHVPDLILWIARGAWDTELKEHELYSNVISAIIVTLHTLSVGLMELAGSVTSISRPVCHSVRLT